MSNPVDHFLINWTNSSGANLHQQKIYAAEISPAKVGRTGFAAIRELEKIELVRGLDGRYRMDHAVTATQKTILGAFRMDARSVKNRANELSELLAGIGE